MKKDTGRISSLARIGSVEVGTRAERSQSPLLRRDCPSDPRYPWNLKTLNTPGNRSERVKAIDLFCGAGGLSAGLKRAGFTVVVCVDSNRDAMETYASHEPDAVHYNMDVQGSLCQVSGTVDLVAGPPCQPFSIGGLKAHADSRDMIPGFIRCLNEFNPKAFIMENVPGLVLRRTRPYFESVIFRLAECGYRPLGQSSTLQITVFLRRGDGCSCSERATCGSPFSSGIRSRS